MQNTALNMSLNTSLGGLAGNPEKLGEVTLTKNLAGGKGAFSKNVMKN